MKIEQRFNINNGIKVKLTDAGVQHFIDFYKNEPYHRVCTPDIDAEGYTKFSMWMLMKIYGSQMNIGSWELPFETNVFVEIEQQKPEYYVRLTAPEINIFSKYVDKRLELLEKEKQRMMKAVEFRVKIGDLYFVSWGEDGTQPTFTLDDMLGALDRARKFDSQEEANEIAKIFGGVAVPVEEGEG
ncbi:hypothetical protein [Listeria newyorkensis]|uniref:hypothetical protein n=1 Tax=Listeria newyorkensis TaxID=1497681 RepID=UPI00051D5E02|nr:hypothetical protein [Listeria newyorkensis]KGL44102.1 hypothetical protein EP58_06540 [Listeria newyorkensis]SQC57477.1 Uncharacterised protein [Listeria newyorkensis]